MNQGRTAREEKDFFSFPGSWNDKLGRVDEALCAEKLQTAMLYTQIEAAWELHCVCTK